MFKSLLNLCKVATSKGEVEIAKNPAKVAIFDWSALDDLRSLGVDNSKFATMGELYLPDLEKLYKNNPRVGEFMQPNLEKLISYQPDLVVVTPYEEESLKELEKLSPVVINGFEYNGNYINKYKSNLKKLGKIFDKEAKAEQLIAEFDSKAKKIRETQKGTALFLLITGNKIATYGATEQSRFGWVLSEFGFRQAIEKIETKAHHGSPVSFEAIKEANPDWLIVLDRGTAVDSKEKSAKAVLDNALVKQTRAWKKGNIVYVPAMLYMGEGSIASLLELADEIMKKIKK